MGRGGYRDQVYVRRDNRFRRDRFEGRDFQPRFGGNRGRWRRFESVEMCYQKISNFLEFYIYFYMKKVLF